MAQSNSILNDEPAAPSKGSQILHPPGVADRQGFPFGEELDYPWIMVTVRGDTAAETPAGTVSSGVKEPAFSENP